MFNKFHVAEAIVLYSFVRFWHIAKAKTLLLVNVFEFDISCRYQLFSSCIWLVCTSARYWLIRSVQNAQKKCFLFALFVTKSILNIRHAWYLKLRWAPDGDLLLKHAAFRGKLSICVRRRHSLCWFATEARRDWCRAKLCVILLIGVLKYDFASIRSTCRFDIGTQIWACGSNGCILLTPTLRRA